MASLPLGSLWGGVGTYYDFVFIYFEIFSGVDFPCILYKDDIQFLLFNVVKKIYPVGV